MLNNIAKTIQDVAFKENEILSEIADDGIFFMPELAFVYECGKAIMRDRHSIFGNNNPVWKRETDIGNGGPTDLIFELDDGYRIAIEFKMRDTADSYIKDIKKLSRIDDAKIIRIFCALIDVFTKNLPDDGRQKTIEDLPNSQVKLISKDDFPTKQNWYTTETSCVTAVWSIGDIPSL